MPNKVMTWGAVVKMAVFVNDIISGLWVCGSNQENLRNSGRSLTSEGKMRRVAFLGVFHRSAFALQHRSGVRSDTELVLVQGRAPDEIAGARARGDTPFWWSSMPGADHAWRGVGQL